MAINNVGNVFRARTIQITPGKRINWERVPYFIFNEDKDGASDIIHVEIRWKYKAGIKTENIDMNKEHFSNPTYFKRYGLVKLVGDTYINLNRIMFIEEVQQGLDSVVVRFVLQDGFEITRKISLTNWIWWRDNFA